jgi:hypothetical protein
MAFIAASGTFAVITGASFEPDAFAVVISAAPTSSPRSDADHDFVLGRFGHRHARERYFQFAAFLDERTQLKPGLAV